MMIYGPISGLEGVVAEKIITLWQIRNGILGQLQRQVLEYFEVFPRNHLGVSSLAASSESQHAPVSSYYKKKVREILREEEISKHHLSKASFAAACVHTGLLLCALHQRRDEREWICFLRVIPPVVAS